MNRKLSITVETYWIGMGGGSEFGKRGHVAGGIQLGNEAGMKTGFYMLWAKEL